MGKRAVIFDLDNTIYPVHSIGEELFATLFRLIEEEGRHAERMDRIRDEIMRRPFQLVATDHGFSEALTQKGLALLKDLTYEGKIEPFEDYPSVRRLQVDKFLVTTGFLKLQQSKVARMNLAPDFKEIHIVDPATSDRTKRDVFADIMQRHGYTPSEVLVVGDDLHSEIAAARQLGIEAVLYDNYGRHPDLTSLPKISSFEQLESLL
jgi:putative hydrolase of the HAD superfamily